MARDATADTAFLAAITARFRLHERCFADRDAAPLAEHFIAPDAVWDFQGFPQLHGRMQVLAFFESVVDTSTVAITPIAWRADGPAGWSLVDYVVVREGEDGPMTLRTVFVWSRSNGGWLVEAGVGYRV